MLSKVEHDINFITSGHCSYVNVLMGLDSSIQMAGKLARILENIEDPDDLAHYELSLEEFYYLTK